MAALAAPAGRIPVQAIGYALVTSLIVGIARAWELVGERDTGLRASIAALTGRSAAPLAAAGGDRALDDLPRQRRHEHGGQRPDDRQGHGADQPQPADPAGDG
jgi:hypothetical protein